MGFRTLEMDRHPRDETKPTGSDSRERHLDAQRVRRASAPRKCHPDTLWVPRHVRPGVKVCLWRWLGRGRLTGVMGTGHMPAPAGNRRRTRCRACDQCRRRRPGRAGTGGGLRETGRIHIADGRGVHYGEQRRRSCHAGRGAALPGDRYTVETRAVPRDPVVAGPGTGRQAQLDDVAGGP